MSSYKLLVVDDRIDSLQIIVNYLRSFDTRFNILQSNSSIKAFEIAQKALPDLIITDWDMPQMDGIELLKQLKANNSTKDIPVIISTGVMITSMNLKVALEAGAFDYIRKPIDPIELQARIHSAIVVTQYHRQAIDAKNHELAENAVAKVKNKEFYQQIRQMLTQLKTTLQLNNDNDINQIIQLIDSQIHTTNLDKFEMSFNAVHPSFLSNLSIKHPDLTSAEIKLCTYIRLGMSIKDVASVLFQNPDSIKVARSRLRKSLNLDTEQNLEAYLRGF
jgi:CheY-like chemotaxis protein/DNA-binding CsgD family transcriptional regulator